MRAALLIAAASLSAVQARPLSDAELEHFYGKAVMSGPTRAVPAPLSAGQTLRDAAAAAGIYIGAAVNYGGMHDGTQGAQYPATALAQFNLFTAENECKVGPVHPQPDVYAFGQCDFLAETAIANASFRMHNFCWNNENPNWLNALKDPTALTAALKMHIGNMSTHYLGSPATAYYAVDVVNEAVSDSGSSILKPTTPWYAACAPRSSLARARLAPPPPPRPCLPACLPGTRRCPTTSKSPLRRRRPT
jgi:GH35 family endo-1,4-beta-xylanase